MSSHHHKSKKSSSTGKKYDDKPSGHSSSSRKYKHEGSSSSQKHREKTRSTKGKELWDLEEEDEDDLSRNMNGLHLNAPKTSNPRATNNPGKPCTCCPAACRALVTSFNIPPAPEPNPQDLKYSRNMPLFQQDHKEWEKGYNEWGKASCKCGHGYFCRAHGMWVSGDRVRNDASHVPSKNQQTPDTCHHSCPDCMQGLHTGKTCKYCGWTPSNNKSKQVASPYESGRISNLKPQETYQPSDSGYSTGSTVASMSPQPRAARGVGSFSFPNSGRDTQTTYYPSERRSAYKEYDTPSKTQQNVQQSYNPSYNLSGSRYDPIVTQGSVYSQQYGSGQSQNTPQSSSTSIEYLKKDSSQAGFYDRQPPRSNYRGTSVDSSDSYPSPLHRETPYKAAGTVFNVASTSNRNKYTAYYRDSDHSPAPSSTGGTRQNDSRTQRADAQGQGYQAYLDNAQGSITSSYSYNQSSGYGNQYGSSSSSSSQGYPARLSESSAYGSDAPSMQQSSSGRGTSLNPANLYSGSSGAGTYRTQRQPDPYTQQQGYQTQPEGYRQQGQTDSRSNYGNSTSSSAYQSQYGGNSQAYGQQPSMQNQQQGYGGGYTNSDNPQRGYSDEDIFWEEGEYFDQARGQAFRIGYKTSNGDRVQEYLGN